MAKNTFDPCVLEQAAETEHMENLIMGGADTAEILNLFPQYSTEDINKRFEIIAKNCWYSGDEWGLLKDEQ